MQHSGAKRREATVARPQGCLRCESGYSIGVVPDKP